MPDYDINGTVFYKLPLFHKGGAYVKTRLAAAWLGLLDPPATLDERHTLGWREQLKNSRQLARSGVVHALAIQPGRLSARVEHPLTKVMHGVRMLAERATDQTWAEVAAHASREAQLAAQIVNEVLPDVFIPALTLRRDQVTVEVDGVALAPDAMPHELFTTPWLVFAERVDVDPWLWVLFRGQTQDGLLDLIRQHGRSQAEAAQPASRAIGETLPLNRFWVMGDVPPMTAHADGGASPVLARLAKSSPGLRVGRRALSAVLRQAYREKQ
jgi:hypothetical protein